MIVKEYISPHIHVPSLYSTCVFVENIYYVF